MFLIWVGLTSNNGMVGTLTSIDAAGWLKIGLLQCVIIMSIGLYRWQTLFDVFVRLPVSSHFPDGRPIYAVGHEYVPIGGSPSTAEALKLRDAIRKANGQAARV